MCVRLVQVYMVVQEIGQLSGASGLLPETQVSPLCAVFSSDYSPSLLHNCCMKIHVRRTLGRLSGLREADFLAARLTYI